MEDIKLVCFDLDKTLVTHNSWYELNLALGMTPEEDQQLFDKYTAGSISYEEWTRELLKLFLRTNKANLAYITEVVSKYTFTPLAKEIVAYVKSKGHEVAIISGSINVLIDLVAKDLGIELAEATNTFVFDESDRLINIVPLGDDKIAKLNLLEGYARKLGISLEQCACVGDGDNDIELFRKTKRGITFKGSKIESEAWKVIDSLEALKSIF